MVATINQMTAWFVISFILVKTSTDALMSQEIDIKVHYHTITTLHTLQIEYGNDLVV